MLSRRARQKTIQRTEFLQLLNTTYTQQTTPHPIKANAWRGECAFESTQKRTRSDRVPALPARRIHGSDAATATRYAGSDGEAARHAGATCVAGTTLYSRRRSAAATPR
eukprot:gene9544-biopygen1687